MSNRANDRLNDYITDHEIELLDTWLDRTDWKAFDKWLWNRPDLIEYLKLKFTEDTDSKAYQDFLIWIRNCLERD